MSALLSVDQADRLVRIRHVSRRWFWSLAITIGTLVCIYLALALAGDSAALPPAPFNSIMFVILTGAAVSALVIQVASQIRLGQLGIAQEFATALANVPVSGTEIARLYAGQAQVVGRLEALRADFNDHIEDTKELPMAVPARGVVVTVVQAPTRRRRSRPRTSSPAAQQSDNVIAFELGRQHERNQRPS